MGKQSKAVKLNQLFAFIHDDLESHSREEFSSTNSSVARLLARMRKKAVVDNPALRDVALDKFRALNASLVETRITLDPAIVREARSFIARSLEIYSKSLDEDSMQECLLFDRIFEDWAFGPGASQDVTGTGTVEKIGQPMTCTVVAEPFVKLLRSMNPYFSCKDAASGCGSKIVKGSRVTTVSKNDEVDRTIAIEPSGNMALQLSVGRYIENTLRMLGLDIRSQQTKNRSLARRGSVDGSVATIDLRSASDMFIPTLILCLWPGDWYHLFKMIRSPAAYIGDDDQPTELNMISTMGNGFTFPMMTITLLALVYANRRVHFNGRPNRIDWSTTAVFGDDIIVPTEEYESLCMVLSGAGLVVNHDKSYASGNFRESCGGDYYRGIDITPFYVKALNCNSDVYVAINQVLRWCAREDIILPRTLTYLRSLLDGTCFLVPEWMSDPEGVRTHICPRDYSYLRQRSVMLRLPERSAFYAGMLAAGGYVVSAGGRALYTPRDLVKVKVRKARLPSGYLDGWDPSYGSLVYSRRISLMAELLLM